MSTNENAPEVVQDFEGQSIPTDEREKNMNNRTPLTPAQHEILTAWAHQCAEAYRAEHARVAELQEFKEWAAMTISQHGAERHGGGRIDWTVDDCLMLWLRESHRENEWRLPPFPAELIPAWADVVDVTLLAPEVFVTFETASFKTPEGKVDVTIAADLNVTIVETGWDHADPLGTFSFDEPHISWAGETNPTPNALEVREFAVALLGAASALNEIQKAVVLEQVAR